MMKEYKIVVLNAVGNTGKSLLASEFLKQRMPFADLIRIETINSHGEDDHTAKLSARSSEEVWEKIDMSDQTIIDVGASNYEQFIQRLSENFGAHEDFNAFIIPTTSDPKAQEDTLATIEQLMFIGVEPQNIRIIFNKYDPFDSVKRMYSKIFGRFDITQQLSLDNARHHITIKHSEAFPSAQEKGIKFTDIANDETDYRKLMRETSGEERAELSRKNTLKRMAKTTNQELDNSFDRLMDSLGIQKAIFEED